MEVDCHDVAAHKRYKKRKGIIVSDADAYSHLRHIALTKKHPPAPTVTPTEPPLVRPVAVATQHSSLLLTSSTLLLLPPTGDTTDVGTRSPLTPPTSPPSNKILVRPTTPRTPSTPTTPSHNPCCVCRSNPVAIVILPCRDQRLRTECWMVYLAAEKEVHGRKEKLPKKPYYGTFVTAPFVPLCPTCRQVVAVHRLCRI